MVPTVRGLAGLESETVESSSPAAPQSGWGPRQSCVSLGAFLVLGAAIGLAGLYATRPENPTHRIAKSYIDSRLPVQQIDEWNVLRSLDQVIPIPNAEVDAYVASRDRTRRWMWMAGGVGALGVIVTLAGFLIPSGVSRK